MQLVDANVLLYAVNADAPHHAASRRWLDDALAGPEPVGFDWVVMLAFLRLATNPRIFPHPLEPAVATTVLRSWLEQPAAVVVQPSPVHLDVLTGLLSSSGTAGNLVTDGHLASLAITSSATVVTFDADFGRFPGVVWRMPEA